jgi:DNA-binding transcriptional LysR family regulator
MLADPGQLRLLALIERHGSLSAAAHALGLTPAAVTQQVAKAERDWKVPLVLRGPRGAALTAAGALLAVHGRAIDEESNRAAAGLAALLGHLSLRLRIGAFQAAALHLLPPALTALRHRYPDADLSIVDVRSERGMHEVAAGRLDMAVIASWDTPATPPQHVLVHPLLLDPLVVVLPDDHMLAASQPRQTAMRLEQLRDEAWVTILAGHAARVQFDRAAATAGFIPKVRFQTESYDVAQALVGTGIGVALVSRLALTGVPGTAHRELARPGLHRQLYAVTLTDTTSTPLVAAFLDLLHDVARDITATWAIG